MAVLGRLLVGSAERLDLPDLLSVDSYIAADFKYLLQSFIGSDRPYILKGFDVIQPQSAIGTESVSIRVADSVAYYPVAGAGSFFYGLPEGNANAEPLIPELRKNATNFVYLTFSTFDTAKDSRAFWDPDANGGDGGEFSQDVNTETVLKVEVNVSVSTFPENTIPVCKVKVGATVIETIQDCRDMMFRLGTGGASPSPFSTYDFRDDPTSTYSRLEPPTTMTSALDPNPFQGGDKNIYTLKEWMDVVMTKLKELGGTPYWYSGSSTGSGSFSTSNIFLDALGSTLKSKGEWQHSNSVAGQATWTEDIHYLSLRDKRDLIIRANTIALSDNQIAWIKLVRDAEINAISQPVTWLNGSATVNGIIGSFVNLTKGDWTKKKTDSSDKYLRVEEFYALPNLAGGTTTPALAQSILLSANYAGLSGSDIGEYTKGEYLLADINITDRDAAAIQAAGGDEFWLAYRSDTSLSMGSAVPTTLSLDITEADGQRARATTGSAHGLVDGDRITIVGGSYAGTYQVEVETTTTFFFETTVTGDDLGRAAYYAIVTTAARSTAYSYSLETANHGFQSNQRVYINSTAYAGNYLINVRSGTTFQIPIGSAIANPGAVSGEIISLPRLNVRTEFGTVKVVQGETINIGDTDSENILTFIGMESMAQTTPSYFTPLGYNALNGYQNYNSDPADNLTVRAAKLTAMMADRIQDRCIQIVGRTNIKSVTSGANQNISALANLTLVKPSSPDQTITMTTPIALPANSAIVADMDRDGSTSITPTVVSLGSQYLLQENRIVLFYRFATDTVYDWRGNQIRPSGHINTEFPEDSQNRNITVFNPGTVSLNTSSGLLTLDVGEGAEKTRVKVLAAASVPQSSYFTFYSALDAEKYYVWYNKDGGGTDPLVPLATGIMVAITTGDTATQVATATISAINGAVSVEVTASNYSADTVLLTNDAIGPATSAADGATATTFLITVIQEGFDPDITIYIPGSSSNTIDVDVINGLGTLIVADGQSVWVRINRFATKTFNTVLTTDTPDTDGAGALYVTNTTAVPIDQDVLVLWTRDGNNILVTHHADDPRANIYEEYLLVVAAAPGVNEVLGPLVSGDELQLPVDSRDSGNVQEYIVGSGQLEVFLNGQYLKRGEDYAEVGDSGALSKRIEILQDLVVNDKIGFRIDAQGAVYFAASSGGGGDLQDAYDAGRFVSVSVGQPIVVSGASGKLISVLGDMEVTGVIDPAGITFSQESSDPLGATDYGLWRNSSDQLIYKRGAGTALNLSNDYLRRDGTLAMTANLDAGSQKIINLATPTSGTDATTKNYVDSTDRYTALYVKLTNNTGFTITAGSVVMLSQSVAGEIILADASVLSTSEAVVGVVPVNIPDAAIGDVQIAGEATVNTVSPLSLGKRVFLSVVSGHATTTPPTVPGETVFVIGFSSDTNKVILWPHLDTVNENVYEEKILVVSGAPANDNQITGPVSIGTSITLPLDSRNSNASQQYIVGKGFLEVYLNGQLLEAGDDYTEVGAVDSTSTSIQIQQTLVVDDELIFRINLSGSAYFATGGGSTSLQAAYNNGNTITVTTGNPVTINGTSGKLLTVNGDVDITGVIDPKALQLTPQSSNPLSVSAEAGLWVDISGNLMYQKGDNSAAINVSNVIEGGVSASASTVTLLNSTGSTLLKLIPVRVDGSGNMNTINVASETQSLACIGIVASDVTTGATGSIITNGLLTNITTTAAFGDVMYVSKTGGLTNTKPSIGVDGFSAGDFVIRIGIISKNQSNPSNKDIIVGVQLVGQL